MKSLRLASLLVLSVSAAFAGASCESPTVGDMCSSSCGSGACEPVCPCGNASCETYECVVTDEAGSGFVLLDGGHATSCSQP